MARWISVFRRSVIVGIPALVLTVGAVVSADACKAAGKFKHVGVVTVVDQADLKVTIKDAETGEPVTFSATAEQLDGVTLGDQVLVGFLEEKDGTLTAVKIQI